MQVVVAIAKQRVNDGCEDAWLIRAEMVARDKIQGSACFGIVLVVPAGIIEAANACDFFRA